MRDARCVLCALCFVSCVELCCVRASALATVIQRHVRIVDFMPVVERFTATISGMDVAFAILEGVKFGPGGSRVSSRVVAGKFERERMSTQSSGCTVATESWSASSL